MATTRPPAKKTTRPPAKKAAKRAPRAKKASARARPGEQPALRAVPDAPPVPLTGRPVNRTWPNAPLRRGLGVALLGLAGADRFAAGDPQVVTGVGAVLPAEPLVDVALGVLDIGLEAGERVAGILRRTVNPMLVRALVPAARPVSGLGGAGLQLLGTFTRPLAERGRRLRADSEYEAAAALAAVLPETIQLVMEQLDLTEIAITQVDVARVLEATSEQVDLTGFAIEHMDLVRLIEASLDQVDFTGVAVTRLDFARATAAAMEQVDLFAIAREQLDPAKVAAYLRDNVDVAEALRAAPGAVAGEAVRNVRASVGRITGRR